MQIYIFSWHKDDLLQDLEGDTMKEKKNKQRRDYEKEGYEALTKHLLTCFQSYLPYCCGWTPYCYDYEPKKYIGDAQFNKHSNKTKEKK